MFVYKDAFGLIQTRSILTLPPKRSYGQAQILHSPRIPLQETSLEIRVLDDLSPDYTLISLVRRRLIAIEFRDYSRASPADSLAQSKPPYYPPSHIREASYSADDKNSVR